MSLAHLVGTLHYICRSRGSNPGHSTYPFYKAKFLTNKLLDKKKKLFHFNYVDLLELEW
jgi:hypothetical protein